MEKILMLKHQSDSIPDSPILFIIVFQSILKKVFSIELTLTNHSQKMWLIGIFLASTIGSYQILLLLICMFTYSFPERIWAYQDTLWLTQLEEICKFITESQNGWGCKGPLMLAKPCSSMYKFLQFFIILYNSFYISLKISSHETDGITFIAERRP